MPPFRQVPNPSVRQEVSEIKRDIADIKRQVNELNSILRVGRNWPTIVADWYDKPVMIQHSSGRISTGILRWDDKYTIAIQEEGRRYPSLFPKGPIEKLTREDS